MIVLLSVSQYGFAKMPTVADSMFFFYALSPELRE